MSIDFKIKADWRPTLKWLKNIQRGSDDARPLWVAMIPRIREFVADEFSGSNPNKWPALTPKYRHWKAKKGFPHWIGVMTGTMKDAAGKGAIIEVKPKMMSWRLDSSQTPTKSGVPYSAYFSYGTSKMPARPIFKSTLARTNSLLRKDIKDMEGGSRAAFTFAWIRKSLEPYRE